MTLTWSKQATLLLLIVAFGLSSLALFSGQMAGITKVSAFYGITDAVALDWLRPGIATLFALMAILSGYAMRSEAKPTVLAVLMLLTALVPLLSLFGTQHWIAALGGFPAIGSGQGIIKYFALIALALTLLSPARLNRSRLAIANLLPVLLVLVWIGGMKFTAVEAKGIEDLVRTSPLMSWLYQLLDLQQSSNLIGLYDLIAASLLLAGWQWRWLFWPGLLMGLAVFLTTQSFLLSFPGSWKSVGLLSSSGLFIIKDLWFIANLLMVIELRQLSLRHRP